MSQNGNEPWVRVVTAIAFDIDIFACLHHSKKKVKRDKVIESLKDLTKVNFNIEEVSNYFERTAACSDGSSESNRGCFAVFSRSLLVSWVPTL